MFIEEKPKNLLSVGCDAKTIKGMKKRYMTGILYLTPYKSWGFNVCPNAENADCHEPCLNFSGRGQFNVTQEARLRKTFLFHYERDWFMAQLYRDIEALERKAQREGMVPCVRLNGTSDIDWEKIRHLNMSPMEQFSNIQFYDYTKLPRSPKNRNYHLTFSYSAAAGYTRSVKKAKRLGMNIAVVFRGDIPDSFLGMKVLSGDHDDLRFLDPKGIVIGLKAKGKARRLESDLIVATG
jgi:hypothetical protein